MNLTVDNAANILNIKTLNLLILTGSFLSTFILNEFVNIKFHTWLTLTEFISIFLSLSCISGNIFINFLTKKNILKNGKSFSAPLFFLTILVVSFVPKILNGGSLINDIYSWLYILVVIIVGAIATYLFGKFQ